MWGKRKKEGVMDGFVKHCVRKLDEERKQKR